MKIIKDNIESLTIEKSVITIGNFDGIHSGHRLLFKKICERAKILNAASVIITFEQHTSTFFKNDQRPIRLTTFDEKVLVLRNSDVDYLICLDFNEKLASLSAADFVRTILIERLKAVEWIMGKNHTFGKDRKGTYDFLHNSDDKNHINVFALNLHTEDTIVASSTKIRNLIGESRIDDAVGMLGHPYPILVQRIRGMRIGFKLGYPTLNFKCPPSRKVIPPPGIYAAEVEYNGLLLKGALYFGNCPTFDNRDYHFEFHALEPVTCDPGVNTEAALWLYSFIRPEKKFNSEDLLIEQIRKDIFLIQQIFFKE